MGKAAENSDEDRVSLKSNGGTPTDPAMKEKMGMFQIVRRSMRRAAEKNPLSPGNKESKVTPKADTVGKELGSTPPPSPSEYHHEI